MWVMMSPARKQATTRQGGFPMLAMNVELLVELLIAVLQVIAAGLNAYC